MKRSALIIALLFLVPALPVVSQTADKPAKPSAAKKATKESAAENAAAAAEAREELLRERLAMARCSNSDQTFFEAAGAGNVEALKAMLGTEAADVAKVDEQGSTALHLAARSKSAETVRLLLAAGADLNAKNAKGLTPVEVAKYMTVRRCLEIAAEKAAGKK